MKSACEVLTDDAAERSILGACLSNNGFVRDGCELLERESFGVPVHRVAWGVMLEFSERGTAFDSTLLHRELERRNVAIDLSVVWEWENGAIASRDLCRQHAKRLIELATRRQVVKVAEVLQAKAADVSVPLTDIRARVDHVTTSLSESGEESRTLPMEAGAVAELLDKVATFLKRFVILSPSQADILALFVVHTHAISAADTTPYISVTSSEKQSGKTRLLECLEHLVARPWLTARVTPAVLVRMVSASCPTLLLDESDAAFGSNKEYAEAVRGILNSGFRRSGKTSLCVPVGKSFEVRDFNTFCAKCIAGIGKLPDTVADRSVPIHLQRKAHSEEVERFRERAVKKIAQPLRAAVEHWSRQNLTWLRNSHPELPRELSDRQQDTCEPLLAIADLAGDNWPQRARKAIVELQTGDAAKDESHGVRLLEDMRRVFRERNRDRLASRDLVEALAEFEGSPWAEWKNGKPMTTHQLARLLSGFRIVPKNIRFDAVIAKGYEFDQFKDAWSRYLPQFPAPPFLQTATPLQPAKTLNETASLKTLQSPPVAEAGSVSEPHTACSVAAVAAPKQRSVRAVPGAAETGSLHATRRAIVEVQ